MMAVKITEKTSIFSSLFFSHCLVKLKPPNRKLYGRRIKLQFTKQDNIFVDQIMVILSKVENVEERFRDCEFHAGVK